LPDKATLRAAVLVSGGGSNLEAILMAWKAGELPRVAMALVLSNRADAFALTRAKNHGVEQVLVESKSFADDALFQDAVLHALVKANIDVIFLAGYLKRIGPKIIQRFKGRILNIHPGLLPKYGGAGMYGHHVHDAVLKSGDKESGCTVHVVDEEFDHGPILAQVRVPVKPGDTAETLAARILEQEHQLYPRVIREFTEKLI
jgi:phosphoribosylglycinamide formyltransferase 1